MMEFNTKCALIGRKKGKAPEQYICFGNLFDINDPHLTDTVPTKFLDFEDLNKVEINGLKACYFLKGNDIAINDLKNIRIERDGKKLLISGVQE